MRLGILLILCATLPMTQKAEAQTPTRDSVAVVPSLFSEGPLTIRFALRETGRVTFEVYDVRGALVRVVDLGPFAAGEHSYYWDARDDWGAELRAGVHFLRMGRVVGPERRRSFQTLARCVIVCRR